MQHYVLAQMYRGETYAPREMTLRWACRDEVWMNIPPRALNSYLYIFTLTALTFDCLERSRQHGGIR